MKSNNPQLSREFFLIIMNRIYYLLYVMLIYNENFKINLKKYTSVNRLNNNYFNNRIFYTIKQVFQFFDLFPLLSKDNLIPFIIIISSSFFFTQSIEDYIT